MIRRRSLLAAPFLTAAPALGQSAAWPSRPVRLIVPFTPGGATDAVARLLAERLSASLGQGFIVENRAGAGGNVGAEVAAKAEPDGYTLLAATISVSALAPHLYPRLNFDPVKDFASIGATAHVANGVLARPDLPASSVAELIALARARPGGLSYGTPGNGTSGHLCAEYLKYQAKIDIQHIPYRGTSPAIADLVGGRLDLCVDNLPSYLPHVREGKLKLLAVTSAEHWFAAPEVPTVAEAALPGFAATAWWGLQAPLRTPEPILARAEQALLAALAEPATQAKLREMGIEALPMGRAAFDRHIAAENSKWGEVIRAAGIRAE
ncbi:Bug family tripartite tricarboxylate transporter substrate binding protein [Belnapia rosea]|uniref:Bug family tripartite tricarboxylate transporter substrate binding protein n=1 Tax=Belnapia rosea TaxID=938405 RepID=UPI0008829450|nr:tripartite tricarboxylate transporter substrate binding protein [Belnapia rosea]SDB67942.1 Tripartite-type tricarboxylate transporter, receptor component TctC [Belnapia rosea]